MQALNVRTQGVPGLVLFMVLHLSGCGDISQKTRHHGKSEAHKIESSPDDPAKPIPTVTGKVIAVKDGDTIVILEGQKQITVRLVGIDSPESGQPFGAKAKETTSELCFGKVVTLNISGQDRYGRTLADVILPDGNSLNRELVRSGFAWWFRDYSDDKTLGELEAEARGNKRGLWADVNPFAPWDWRRDQKAEPETPRSEVKIVPNGMAFVALLPNPHGEDAGNEQVTLGNSTGKTVDLSGWKLLDRVGQTSLLSGRIEPGKSLVVTLTEETMPLNNEGDTIVLIDAEGVGRSRVSYEGSQVRSGTIVQFGQ